MFDFADPYLDPATGILRNKLGVTEQSSLEVTEADPVEARRAQMITRPVKVTGDLRQLQAIHGHLFQDLYDWAGQLRTVDIRKGTDPAAEFFMPVSRLESGAGFAFAELADDKQLRGMGRERFVMRLAHHYDQVNYLQPFREGDWRSQRIFWTQIAAGAGYDLGWSRVTGAENDQASRNAMERRDFTGLRAMFDRIVQPATPGSQLTPERLEQLRTFANLDHGAAPGRSQPSSSTEQGEKPPGANAGVRHGRGEGSVTVVGYARVSKREQRPDAQEVELRAAGAERVFVDHGDSSRVKDGPQWAACMDYMRAGDVLLVRRLDRLGGTERILIETLHELEDRGVDIKSLTEPVIDTTSPMGRALFGIVAVFAQLCVDTIRENTRLGLEYARSQGRVGGRPTVMTPERVAVARRMREERATWDTIAKTLRVGSATVRRALSPVPVGEGATDAELRDIDRTAQ